MKIELRKFEHYPRLSQETNAFNAQLWIDGAYAAEASNEGHGDSNMLRFKDHKLEEKFHEYCKTLPPLPADPKKGYGELSMDADLHISCLVEDMINDAQEKKWLARNRKTKVVFSLPGHAKGEYMTVKFPPNGRDKAVAHVRAKYPDATIY